MSLDGQPEHQYPRGVHFKQLWKFTKIMVSNTDY